MSYEDQLAHVCNDAQLERVKKLLILGVLREWMPFALQPGGWVALEGAMYPDEPSSTISVGVNGNVVRESVDDAGGWVAEFWDDARCSWSMDDEADFAEWLGVDS